MNCDDVAAILNERAENRLAPGERCALDAHLASCGDCAHAWLAEQALLAQRVPAARTNLLDLVLRAVDAQASPRQRHSSRLVLGAVLFAGAALAAIGVTIEARRSAQEAQSQPATPPPGSAPAEPLVQPPASVEDALTDVAENDLEDRISFPDGDYFALLRSAPEYPPNALKEKRDGHVQVQFTVTKYGTVEDVTVVESSDPEFEPTAILAVSRWKFMPRVVDGKRVAVRDVHTVIRFQLEGPRPPPSAQVEPPGPAPTRDGPALSELLVPAWNCAAVRNFLCAQQVLDEISARYSLLPYEESQVRMFYAYLYTQYGDYERAIAVYKRALDGSAVPTSDLRLTLAHLYFSRQQYQLALDTAVLYLRDLEQRLGRKPMEVQRFVDKLTQLGLTPTVQ
jgi:protein TonB